MLGAIGMASSLIPSIIGWRTAKKQKKLGAEAAKKADALNAQTLGWADQGLNTARQLQAEARNLYNGRMAGAGAMEQGIQTNQANTLGRLQRGASSSADLLATAGGVQGAANNALANLAQMEAQNKQAQFGNLAYANRGVQGAQQNLQQYYGGQADRAQQAANDLMNAAMINNFNAWQGVANTGMMVDQGIQQAAKMLLTGGLSGLSGGSAPAPQFHNQLLPGAGTPIGSGLYKPSFNYSLPFG